MLWRRWRWRGRRGGRSRASVVLRVLRISIQQHMTCQRAARLVMIISLACSALLCMAALLPSPLLSLSSTRYGGGEKKKEREREKGQPCASRTISTQMCALNAEWGMQQGVAHTRTHAVGGHPSFHTTARRRGAATDMASLCGGVGHGQAGMAWWPWSAAQLVSMVSTCAKPREERVCVRGGVNE